MSSMLEGGGDCIGFHRLHSVGPFTGIIASSTSLEDLEHAGPAFLESPFQRSAACPGECVSSARIEDRPGDLANWTSSRVATKHR